MEMTPFVAVVYERSELAVVLLFKRYAPPPMPDALVLIAVTLALPLIVNLPSTPVPYERESYFDPEEA